MVPRFTKGQTVQRKIEHYRFKEPDLIFALKGKLSLLGSLRFNKPKIVHYSYYKSSLDPRLAGTLKGIIIVAAVKGLN